MSTRNRIPPTIEPYLRIPAEKSLILLTGTLGCSANWITALFLSAILAQRPDDALNVDANAKIKTPCVLFVSWMRDFEFWKEQVKRTTSLDISKLEKLGQFSFLDCLSASAGLEGNSLSRIDGVIQESISKLQVQQEKQIFLILDTPDVILATSAATAQQLNLCIMKLRTKAHSTILSCSADVPLVAASVDSSSHLHTPIEIETAAFLTQQAHAARFIMSVRELSTGAASDVSGVLRITRSGSCDSDESSLLVLNETEVLYLVQRDGSVKIFGRGEVSG